MAWIIISILCIIGIVIIIYTIYKKKHMQINVTSYSQIINGTELNDNSIIVLDSGFADIPIIDFTNSNNKNLTLGESSTIIIKSKIIGANIIGNNSSIVADNSSYLFDKCTWSGTFTNCYTYATNFGCIPNLGTENYEWDYFKNLRETFNDPSDDRYNYARRHSKETVKIYIPTDANHYDNYNSLKYMFNSVSYFDNSTLCINGGFYSEYLDYAGGSTSEYLKQSAIDVKGPLNKNETTDAGRRKVNNLTITGYSNSNRGKLLTGLTFSYTNNLNLCYVDILGYHAAHELPPYSADTWSTTNSSTFYNKYYVEYAKYYPYKSQYELYGFPGAYEGGNNLKDIGVRQGTGITLLKYNTNSHVHYCDIEMRSGGIAIGKKGGDGAGVNNANNRQNYDILVNNCKLSYFIKQPIGTHASFCTFHDITTYYALQGIDFSEGSNNCYMYNSSSYRNVWGWKYESSAETLPEDPNHTLSYYSSYNNVIDNIYYEMATGAYYMWDNVDNVHPMPKAIDVSGRMPYISQGQANGQNWWKNITLDINYSYRFRDSWVEPKLQQSYTYIENCVFNYHGAYQPTTPTVLKGVNWKYNGTEKNNLSTLFYNSKISYTDNGKSKLISIYPLANINTTSAIFNTSNPKSPSESLDYYYYTLFYISGGLNKNKKQDERIDSTYVYLKNSIFNVDAKFSSLINNSGSVVYGENNENLGPVVLNVNFNKFEIKKTNDFAWNTLTKYDFTNMTAGLRENGNIIEYSPVSITSLTLPLPGLQSPKFFCPEGKNYTDVNGSYLTCSYIDNNTNTITYMSNINAITYNNSMTISEIRNGHSVNVLNVPRKLFIPKDVTLSNVIISGNNSEIIVEPDENNLNNHVVFGDNVTFEGTFAYSYMKSSYFGMIDGITQKDYYWEWTDDRHVKTVINEGPINSELNEYTHGQNTNGVIKTKIEQFLNNSYSIDLELDGDYFTDITSSGSSRARFNIYNASYLNLHGSSESKYCNTLFSLILYGCDNTEISYINLLGYHGVHEFPTAFSSGKYWGNPKMYSSTADVTLANTCRNNYPYKGIIDLYGDPYSREFDSNLFKNEYKSYTLFTSFGVSGVWGVGIFPYTKDYKISSSTNEVTNINVAKNDILRLAASVQTGTGTFKNSNGNEINAATYYNYSVNPNYEITLSDYYTYNGNITGYYLGTQTSYYYYACPVIKLVSPTSAIMYNHITNTSQTIRSTTPVIISSQFIGRISFDRDVTISSYMWCDGKKYASDGYAHGIFLGNETDINNNYVKKYTPSSSMTLISNVLKYNTNTNIHDCHVEMRQSGIAVGQNESHSEVNGTYINNCTFDHIFFQPIGSHGSNTYVTNIYSNYCLQGIDVSTGANNFYIKDSIFNNCAIGPKTASNYDYAEYSYNINFDNVKINMNNKFYTNLCKANPINPAWLYIGTSIFDIQTECNSPRSIIELNNCEISNNVAYVPSYRNVNSMLRAYTTVFNNCVINNSWSWDFAYGEMTTENVKTWIQPDCTRLTNINNGNGVDVNLITVGTNKYGDPIKLPINYNNTYTSPEYHKKWLVDPSKNISSLYESKLSNGSYFTNYNTPTVIFNNSYLISSPTVFSPFGLQSSQMNYEFNNTYLIYDNPYHINTVTHQTTMISNIRENQQQMFELNNSTSNGYLKLSYYFSNFYVPQPGIGKLPSRNLTFENVQSEIVPVKCEYKNKVYRYDAVCYNSNKYVSSNVKQRYYLDNWGYNNFPQDTIAMYYGGRRNRRKWIEPELDVILKHTFTNGNSDWFFRSFLYLDFWIDKNINDGYVSARTFSDNQQSASCPPATKEQWEILLANYFSENKYNASINSSTNMYNYTKNANGQYHEGLRALDEKIESLKSELGEPNFKHKVILGIPLPCTNFTEWGTLDNEVMDFRIKEHRIKVTKWVIDEIVRRFNENNYKNIVLEGIYWVDETTSMLNWKKDKNGIWTIYKLDSNGDRLTNYDYIYENNVKKQNDIIRDIAVYIHFTYRNLAFYWLPYNTAYGNETDDWTKKFNFSRCETQTGYFWGTPEHPGHAGSTAMTTAKLNELCDKALLYGKGMQIEISRFLFKSYWDSEQPTNYSVAPTFDSTNTYAENLYNRINTLLNILEQKNMFNTKKINLCYYLDNYAALNLFESNNATIKTLADRIASHIILRNTL